MGLWKQEDHRITQPHLPAAEFPQELEIPMPDAWERLIAWRLEQLLYPLPKEFFIPEAQSLDIPPLSIAMKRAEMFTQPIIF